MGTVLVPTSQVRFEDEVTFPKSHSESTRRWREARHCDSRSHALNPPYRVASLPKAVPSRNKPDSCSKKFSLHFCCSNSPERVAAARACLSVLLTTLPGVVHCPVGSAAGDLTRCTIDRPLHPRSRIPPGVPPPPVSEAGRTVLRKEGPLFGTGRRHMTLARLPPAGGSQSGGSGGLGHAEVFDSHMASFELGSCATVQGCPSQSTA